MPCHLDKVPPHDLEAERCLLGSLSLNDNLDDVRAVAGELEARHFYIEKHGLVFESMQQLLAESSPLDIVTVGHRMKRNGWWECLETPAYLIEVIACVPHAYHVRYYAEIVIELWRRRRMVDAAEWLTQRASDMTADVDETWEKLGVEVLSQKKWSV